MEKKKRESKNQNNQDDKPKVLGKVRENYSSMIVVMGLEHYLKLCELIDSTCRLLEKYDPKAAQQQKAALQEIRSSPIPKLNEHMVKRVEELASQMRTKCEGRIPPIVTDSRLNREVM